jgi:hypothetical protein
MASITIQVTVQSGTFLWTRTAVVEGIEAVSLHSGNPLNFQVGGSETLTTSRHGLYSYGGVAVAVMSNKGRGSVLQVFDRDSSNAQIGSALLPTYLPHIVYGGAGTGFTGALSASDTGTDLPTDDLDGIGAIPYIGATNIQTLYGFKPIS